MKYILLTPCGLCLELTGQQVYKCITFGKNVYKCDISQDDETGNIQALFIDGDRWIYEIDIFDETHPLD